MLLKKHVLREQLHLVIIDENVRGKKLEEGKKQLDLTSSFYDGVETSKEEIKKYIEQAYCMHFVGEESVAFAQELKLVDEVMYVNEVPFAFIQR